MTATSTIKAATRASLLIALGIGLGACGSGDAAGDTDGEYFGQDGSDLATVVIDGNSLTYTEPQCEGEDKGTSSGELNEDRTLVVWLEEGRFSGDDTVTLTETSLSIASNEGDPKDRADVFVRKDADASKAVYAEHENECTNRAKAREEADTQREADKKARESSASETRSAIDAMTTAEMADCLGVSESVVEEFEKTGALESKPTSAGCLKD